MRILLSLVLLLFVNGCVSPNDIKSRSPDYVIKFNGSAEKMAQCIENEAINRAWGGIRRSVRDNVQRVSLIGHGTGVALSWEISLYDSGLAEIRGFPTVWGGAHGEEGIELLDSCNSSKK